MRQRDIKVGKMVRIKKIEGITLGMPARYDKLVGNALVIKDIQRGDFPITCSLPGKRTEYYFRSDELTSI